MSGLANFPWIASVAVERLLYSVVEGTVLAIIVWVLLRLVPGRNSQTRFAAWFATLLAIAVLPLLSASLFSESLLSQSWRPKSTSVGSEHALITVSSTWAVYIFLGWMAMAFAGLTRVAVAMWQLRRLRSSCVAVDPQILGPEEAILIEECRRVRSSSIMVSRCVEVPTAVGFFNPVIILPAWLVEETGPGELKYIVLHEMAHLRRRDDWTNLAQKVVKALLFFHPGIWWVERRLSLDREMACDDAVLAQSGSPRGYAECLARVAQKSFLRRQLALAQAAVSRMRQLSLRVTQIMSTRRPLGTQLWKPAIPLITIMAALCAFSASYMPRLVSFTADAPAVSAPIKLASHATDARHPASPVNAQSGVRAWDVAWRSGSSHRVPKMKQDSSAARPHARKQVASASNGHDPDPQEAGQPRVLFTTYLATEAPEPLVVQEELFMVFTSFRTASGVEENWQMQVWQLRVVAPTAPLPKVTPRKT
jgi:beta-lactamase regulating signal transducer with metallopeptidase domain